MNQRLKKERHCIVGIEFRFYRTWKILLSFPNPVPEKKSMSSLADKMSRMQNERICKVS